jgi:hypothetical protein
LPYSGPTLDTQYQVTHQVQHGADTVRRCAQHSRHFARSASSTICSSRLQLCVLLRLRCTGAAGQIQRKVLLCAGIVTRMHVCAGTYGAPQKCLHLFVQASLQGACKVLSGCTSRYGREGSATAWAAPCASLPALVIILSGPACTGTQQNHHSCATADRTQNSHMPRQRNNCQAVTQINRLHWQGCVPGPNTTNILSFGF